jgi:hypothetical protein
MAIPKAQLDSWANRGADTASADSYARVRKAIIDGWPSGRKQPKIYLQGSYANDTNTRGDSDVDVVVEYEDTFNYDVSSLPDNQQALWRLSYPTNATYLASHVRQDTLAALQRTFGVAAVTSGKKALKVGLGGTTRMTVDVVPATKHREYHSFVSLPGDVSEGIHFYDSAGNAIINYPLLHITNGQAKNNSSRTGGNFKPTVRLFKNYRTYLVDKGLLADSVAPSYFVECLLYNVPDHLFAGSLDAIAHAILNHLYTTTRQNFVTQSGRIYLHGPGNTQWPAPNADAFILAAVNGWNNWKA